MRTFSRLYVAAVVALFLLISFGIAASPVPTDALSLNDDGDSAQPAPKPAAAPANAKKPLNAPSDPLGGLTEREKMLLDRVEQLERRVEELEAAHASTSVPAGGPAQPAAPSAMLGAAAITPRTFGVKRASGHCRRAQAWRGSGNELLHHAGGQFGATANHRGGWVRSG